MWLAAATLLLCLPCEELSAQRVDTVGRRHLAAGVDYLRPSDATRPLAMHLLRIDLRRAAVELRGARAHDSLRGRERTSDMVRRAAAGGTHVLAAVNADFFWLDRGENENNQVIGGEWWKGVRVTDSPYDAWDNAHVQLAVDSRGRAEIERYQFDGVAIAHGAATPILTLNFNPAATQEGVVLYTPRFGAATPKDTSRVLVEVAMIAQGRRGDTLVFLRGGAAARIGGSPIPADGAVLAAWGNGVRNKEVLAMNDGDTVRVLLRTTPHLPRAGGLKLLIGGWPQLLRGGKDISADAPRLEATLSRNAEMPHPRTAIGVSRDRSRLYLLAVDGRSESSGGLTLRELAVTLRRLGAWDAMNFDGGGSTTMVIGAAVVNAPSDATGERAVGNALLVVARPHPRR